MTTLPTTTAQFNIGDRVKISESYKPSRDEQFANLHGAMGTIQKTTIVKTPISLNRKTMLHTYDESFGYEVKLDVSFVPYSTSKIDFWPVDTISIKAGDLI